MKDFEVYFELFGKKMKTTILANSKEEAESILRSKIIIHKIEVADSEFNQCVDILDKIIDIFTPKK